VPVELRPARRVMAAIAVTLSACAHPSSGPRSPAPESAAPPGMIAASDLQQRVYLFADDSMAGRYPGTRQYDQATAYVASEFRRLGLTPGGDSGGYFQFVPFVATVLDTSARLMTPDGPVALWRDYIPINALPVAASFNADGAPAIYAGVLRDSMPVPSPDVVAGKLVVFTLGRTRDGQLDTRSTRFLPRARMQSAAALAVVYPDGPSPALVATYHQRRFTLPQPPATQRSPILLVIGPRLATALFGAAVESVPVGTVHAPMLQGRVRFGPPDTVWARNVVGILPGVDPGRRDEYVALGAHNDHIGVAPTAVDHDSLRAYNILSFRLHGDGPAAGNASTAHVDVVVNVDSLRRIRPPRRDSVFNGADDDGAGTASLLAIAQAFATDPRRPARSVLFISHAGEEQGLLGSRWYADHPTVPRDSIVAYLNMDLLGAGYAADSARAGPRYLQAGGARRLSSELGALIDSVNAALPEPMAIDYSWDVAGHPSQKYCRSDHASYARYGIPVSFFSTGYSVDYHQVTDEPQYLDYAHLARVARLVYAVARRVADRDHRPIVDHPKPDPSAPCRQ
jgi:hypothetical protein